MPRKAVVPKTISKAIGGFAMSRSLRVRLRTDIHSHLPTKFEAFRQFRHPDDDTLFLYSLRLKDDHGSSHLFVMAVDDVTSPATGKKTTF